MPKVDNPPPFEEYTVYKVFHKGMGRWMAQLVPLGEGKRTTISYAKYLMSIEEGRILSREEEVDHVDGDRQNDSLSNLEIVTKTENRKRQKKFTSRDTVELACPHCGKTFTRDRRNTHLASWNSHRKHTFCSRKCSGAYKRS